MAKTLWKQDNQGQYLSIPTGSTIDAAIDLLSKLKTGEKLATVTHTVTQGNVTINNSYTHSDQIVNGTRLHRAVCWLTPNTVGTHTIRVATTTTLGRTYVYSFDVRSET